jgi:prepilin-type N-terminal cleavage/methylation domain-containing protein
MKNKQLITRKLGFTILELSIVLIIISIIVAAILTGNNLLTQAKLATARQITSKSPALSIDNLVIWFETTTLNNAHEDKIENWSNIAESKKPATQKEAAKQPQYIDNTINGLPVIRFDGVDDFLSFDGSPILNNNYTIFIVAARSDGKSNNMILGGTDLTANNNLQIGYESSSFIAKHYDETSIIRYNIGDYNAPIFAIHGIEFSSSTGKTYYENGTSKATNKTATANLNGWARSAIGRFNNINFSGDIAEIIMFNRVLSNDERKDMEQYLIKKWGIKLESQNL